MTDADRIAELEARLRRALDEHRYHDKGSAFPPTCGVCTGAWPCDNPTCPVGAGFAVLDGKDGER